MHHRFQYMLCFKLIIILFSLLLFTGCSVFNKQSRLEIARSKLKHAAEDGDLARYQALLIKYPEIVTEDGAALYSCPVRLNRFSIIVVLTDLKVDINGKIDQSGKRPIHIAARDSNKYVLQLLLDKGANANLRDNNGNLPIYFAAKSRSLLYVKIFNKQGNPLSSINKRGENLLHAVARSGRDDEYVSELIKYLVDNGVDINKKNKFGKTPLHLASPMNIYNSGGPVIPLLKNGADPRIKDNDGKTPLDLALASKPKYASTYKIIEALRKYMNK